jgi:hypothetical protein
MNPKSSLAVIAVSVLSALSCGGGGVNNEEQARKAYIGLDQLVGKSMALGFQGFNAASSANISTQTTAGAKSGTLSVGGQVDQGNSPSNKGMRLTIETSSYSDGDVVLDGGSTTAITYDAPRDGGVAPALNLKLSGIPDGTFSGDLVGEFGMSGGLSGFVKLDLALAGDLMASDAGTVRKPGTTKVTGTATSGGTSFTVNVTL